MCSRSLSARCGGFPSIPLGKFVGLQILAKIGNPTIHSHPGSDHALVSDNFPNQAFHKIIIVPLQNFDYAIASHYGAD